MISRCGNYFGLSWGALNVIPGVIDVIVKGGSVCGRGEPHVAGHTGRGASEEATALETPAATEAGGGWHCPLAPLEGVHPSCDGLLLQL